MRTALRHSIKTKRSQGILTLCPSATALAIPLGPTNPPLTIIEEETLVFRRAGFSPALWLLVPTFLLPNAPPWVTPLASSQIGILSYRLRTSLRNQDALGFYSSVSYRMRGQESNLHQEDSESPRSTF